jgi:hypothetical protein
MSAMAMFRQLTFMMIGISKNLGCLRWLPGLV